MTGTQLRTIRKTIGLNQQQLADLLGYTRQMVGNWERGEYEVPKVVSLCLKLLEGCEDNVRERALVGKL